MLRCGKCGGMMFLDRTYSDNVSYEIFCIMCGNRLFVQKTGLVGRWLAEKERLRMWGF